MPWTKEALLVLLALWRQREFNVNQKKTHQKELHPLKIIKTVTTQTIKQLEHLLHWSNAGDSGITHPFLGIECNCHQEQHPRAGKNSANKGHHHLLMKSNTWTETWNVIVTLPLRIMVGHGDLQKSWILIAICNLGHNGIFPGRKESLFYPGGYNHDK